MEITVHFITKPLIFQYLLDIQLYSHDFFLGELIMLSMTSFVYASMEKRTVLYPTPGFGDRDRHLPKIFLPYPYMI